LIPSSFIETVVQPLSNAGFGLRGVLVSMLLLTIGFGSVAGMKFPGVTTWYWRSTEATPSGSVTLAVMIIGTLEAGCSGVAVTCRIAGGATAENWRFCAPGEAVSEVAVEDGIVAGRHEPPRLGSSEGLISSIEAPSPSVTTGQGKPTR
jgi:hypothetical protein